MQLVQKSGFARWQVLDIATQTGVDTHAAFMGTEISDKLVSSLVEQAEKLKGVSMGSAKSAFLVTDASSVFVWPVKVNGDVYERNVGAFNVRGSLNTLRGIYGASNVHVTDEKGVRKILSTKKADKRTLAFYKLSHLAKSSETKASAPKNQAKKSGAKKDTRVKVNAKAKK